MSTPIETNTEELQEILQTVYNLPMAGGGSAEPDLVIEMNEPSLPVSFTMPEAFDASWFSVLSGDVATARDKIRNGELPTVLCKLNYHYGGGFFHTVIHADRVSVSDNEGYTEKLYVEFFLRGVPCSVYYDNFNIGLVIEPDFTITGCMIKRVTEESV